VAGPSIVVRILGDLKGLSGAVDAAASKGAGAAGKLKSAFTGTLSALNQTGVLGPFQGAIDGVSSAMDQLGEHSKTTGTVMMGIGGTMAGVGVALSAFGSKEKASHDQLKASVEATGASYDDYAKRIDAAGKRNEHFGYTTAQTDDALRVLTQATGSPKKALDLLGTATDLAAAKHEDLNTAATQLGRAYNGAGKIFKEFGITVTKTATIEKAVSTASKAATSADQGLAAAKKRLADIEAIDAGKKKLTVSEAIRLRDAESAVQAAAIKSMTAHSNLSRVQDAAKKATSGQGAAIDQLAQKLHGQAAAAANTFSGHIKAMTATVEDAASRFGQKFGPALTVAGTVMAGLGGTITATQGIIGMFSKGQEAAAATTEAVTAAEGTEAVASWAALGPLLLIIGAIAALVVAGYVIYRNWKTIWNGIHAAIQFVWDWIKKNWPLLLPILMGPIGIAVLLILKYWKQILGGIQDVWNWIRTAWSAIYQWLVAPFISAVGQIIGFMRSILNAVVGVWNWIRGAWSAIYGWLSGPFLAARGAVSGAMTSIWNSITGVYNWIARSFGAVEGWITTPFWRAYDTVRNIWNSLYSIVSGAVSRMSGLFGGMWNGITDAMRWALNGLIDLWNRLHLTIGGWTAHAGPLSYTFPKVDVGMPPIPHLAQGGLITKEGLVYAHAGEAITPAPGRTSPAIWIEHLEVAETLDVDAFMKRAAWHVQRERI
jgi:hypothetical protein